jgi:hypothetical protein
MTYYCYRASLRPYRLTCRSGARCNFQTCTVLLVPRVVFLHCIRAYNDLALLAPLSTFSTVVQVREMISTMTGDSGRIYTHGALLRRYPQESKYDIFKVEFVSFLQEEMFLRPVIYCAGQSCVLKHVPKSFFELSKRIVNESPSSDGLRMHVDCNSEDSVLVYPYFQSTLLVCSSMIRSFRRRSGWK